MQTVVLLVGLVLYSPGSAFSLDWDFQHVAPGNGSKPEESPRVTYHYAGDDGTAEVQIGLINGGSAMGLRSFTAVAGREWITEIAAVWGAPTFTNPLVGRTVIVALYEDPNDDGSPDDAVLLTTASSVISTAHQNEFDVVPIRPTEVEGSFFVAVLMEDQPADSYWIALDENTTDATSWLTNTSPGVPFDLEETPRLAFPISGTPLGGGIMVRALGRGDGQTADVRVTEIGTGNPAVGAEVALYANAGRLPGTAVTDRHGHARFVNLRSEGPYGAEASRSGLTSPRGYVNRVDNTPVQIHLELGTNVVLSGRIVDRVNGIGITGATVELRRDGTPTGASTVTGDGGVYAFDVSLLGTYTVAAGKEGVASPGTAPSVLYREGLSEEVIVDTRPGTYVVPTDSLTSNVVILLHGIASTSAIWQDSGGVPGMASTLRGNGGWTVIDDIDLPGCVGVLGQFLPCIADPMCGLASVQDQANALAARVTQLPVESVQVVAHSQGGLVARWYAEITSLGVSRIDDLITLGTPHHGSQLATTVDWAVNTIILRGVLSSIQAQNPILLGLSIGAYLWWQEFNQSYPALQGLQPDSDMLRVLNHKDYRIPDWQSLSCIAPPPVETRLAQQTRYVSIRGTGGIFTGDLCSITGDIVLSAPPFFCPDNDGVVPAASAQLYATDADITNLTDVSLGDVTRHQKRAPTYGPIFRSPVIQDWIANTLGGGPIVASPAAATTVTPVAVFDWSTVDGYSHALAADSVATTTISIGATDSLGVDWNWILDEVVVELRTPSGVTIDSTVALVDPLVTWDRDPSFQRGEFMIADPEPGIWSVIARAPSTVGPHGVYGALRARGVPYSQARIRSVSDDRLADRLVEVEIADGAGPTTDATVTALATGPSGTPLPLTLSDDGVPPDMSPGDGIYSANVSIEPAPGTTLVEYQATLTTPSDFVITGSTSLAIGDVSDVAVVGPQLDAVSDQYRVGATLDLRASVANLGASEQQVRVRFLDTTRAAVLAVQDLVLAGGTTVDVEASLISEYEADITYAVECAVVGGVVDPDLVNNTAETTVAIGATVTGAGPRGNEVDIVPDGSRLRILSARPNPFNPALTVSFRNEVAGRVRVEVFDLRGRYVRTLAETSFSAGLHEVHWDGRNGSGEAVASGVYLVRVKAGAENDVVKTSLIR